MSALHKMRDSKYRGTTFEFDLDWLFSFNVFIEWYLDKDNTPTEKKKPNVLLTLK